STDWRRALETTQPDIVAMATPAVVRGEVIKVAVAQGCHIFCDKPLATTEVEAGRLYRAVRDAGVKHAYAATHRYDPSVSWLHELARDGSVGSIHEMSMTIRAGFPGLIAWSWMRTLEGGGGVLNNLLPHLLGIFERIAGGEVVSVMGEARVLTTEAPVVPDLHDFRDWLKTGRELTPESAKGLEWRAIDADGAFSALMRIKAPERDISLTVLHGSGYGGAAERTGMRLYGDKGTLIADGVVGFQVSRQRRGEESPEVLDTPQRLLDELPNIGDHVQNKWCALAKSFVADVRGEDCEPYLTFRDGWRYQRIIETIREGHGWTDISVDAAQR
ncbi:MAG: Gfo/Idh/MocA family oxidoreductase, partial [Candidatus Poribacteria bacterium]|nr:Gfo/Idh/MocA family oxidoreductase [Candidatus Poribacteria bacterium]